MITAIIVAIAITATTVLATTWIVKLWKQRKEYKMWLRLTDGQEATEL